MTAPIAGIGRYAAKGAIKTSISARKRAARIAAIGVFAPALKFIPDLVKDPEPA